MALSTVTTHQHLLAIVNTICQQKSDDVIRILDIGCGDGKLMALLHVRLHELYPACVFEVYGFDVGDHGVQTEGFMSEAARYLETEAPGSEWNGRVSAINVGDDWPYEDGFFDISISNQVLEHVDNRSQFFSEVNRTLKDGGVSVHVYPLIHVINEPHLFIPFVHRFGSHDILSAWIRWASRIGVGKFRSQKRRFGVTLDDFVQKHADYIHYYTNYMTANQALACAKSARLRVSFRYTFDFYKLRLRRLFRMKPYQKYSSQPEGVLRGIGVWGCRKISSVTLYLEKQETYTQR